MMADDRVVPIATESNSGPLLGYRMLNPNAPSSEPRRFEPVNENFQRKAERMFRVIAEAP